MDTRPQKALLEAARKAGAKSYTLSMPKGNAYAERIRKSNLDHYSNPQSWMSENQRRDYAFNIKAYQQMTPDEVILSENRAFEVNRKELEKIIQDLREFQKESRKVVIIAK